MRILRLPDEHLADLIADGPTVIMALRWHARTPAAGDRIHLDTWATGAYWKSCGGNEPVSALTFAPSC